MKLIKAWYVSNVSSVTREIVGLQYEVFREIHERYIQSNE